MKNIAKALAAAQAEMGKAQKASENPHFRSKYADLGNVMDACVPALNKNGIAVIQTMEGGDLGRDLGADSRRAGLAIDDPRLGHGLSGYRTSGPGSTAMSVPSRAIAQTIAAAENRLR